VRETTAGKIEQALRYEEIGTQGYARYRLLQTCWQLFVANPWLGIGPKNFRAVSERYLASRETGGYSVLAAEQWPLGKAAEQGVVGYAAFLYLMYVLLQPSFQLMRRQPLDRIAVTLFAFFVYITAELGEWFATERGHINFIFIGLLMAAAYRGSPRARPQAVDGELA
jgi:O-antigen ligase